jgi:uncharacterized protein YjeT (DUF2065 family)
MGMQNALWLASIFGPFLVITGLWMLLYSENLIKIVTSVKNTPACFYLMGVINLLIGLTIISQYNIWNWDAAFLVTLLGWVLILRGILSLFVPQLLLKMTMNNNKTIKLIGIIPFIWGIALCWFAFS